MKVFKTWIYHKTEEPKIINSDEYEKYENEGWRDTPAAFVDVKKDFGVDPDDSLKVQMVGHAIENMKDVLNTEINIDIVDDRSELLDYADKRFNVDLSHFAKMSTIRRKIKELLDGEGK